MSAQSVHRTDDPVPTIGPGESTTFTVFSPGPSAIVFLPDQQPWGGWGDTSLNPGTILAGAAWNTCPLPPDQAPSVSGTATACGLAPQPGIAGIGVIAVTVSNPASGVNVVAPGVHLYAGSVDPDNLVDSILWASIEIGATLSGSFGMLDAGTYVARLNWETKPPFRDCSGAATQSTSSSPSVVFPPTLVVVPADCRQRAD